jgi:hypothetical protein
MSAFRPEADIWAGLQHVCFVPKAEVINVLTANKSHRTGSPLTSCELPGALQGFVLSANVTVSNLSGGFAGALRQFRQRYYLPMIP